MELSTVALGDGRGWGLQCLYQQVLEKETSSPALHGTLSRVMWLRTLALGFLGRKELLVKVDEMQ